MKTISRLWKMVALLAIVAAAVTAITLAADKQNRKPPSEHGVRLVFGCNGKESLHVTRASLDAALATLPSGQDQYNVEYKAKDSNSPQNFKKGNLKLVSCQDIDIGGAVTPPLSSIAAAGGINVTQQSTFETVTDLQAFTSKLVVEP
ncbi:MAG TPA: hypothetical protein VGZ31_03325 [Chthoniobacterales bacterium]|jgi:hypothetical protein|nr:hypothetical protein [Chthoniobacterales bacterium]